MVNRKIPEREYCTNETLTDSYQNQNGLRKNFAGSVFRLGVYELSQKAKINH